ncbi:MAG TPA: glycoside hydrolase family 3 C-terminal domain-containing protein [Chitinophagaceae bacterium]|nr:glycoside hydrolase family 3 C-terminal domain-containing protein [Chitinophagaceae bacterium]
MKYLLFLILVLGVPMAVIAQTPTKSKLPQLGKAPLSAVVAAMTLKEKASLVVGMGFRIPAAIRKMINKRRDSAGSFHLPPSNPNADRIPEKVPGAAGRTQPIPRLGIPSITMSDGPAGVRINPIRNHDSSRTYYATGFPVATLLASTWDTAMVRKVGVAFGKEVHAFGVDIILGPAMNIQRNPLDGRNFEYYSEDPVIAGNMAAAMVNGLQSNGVGTSIKHFVANNQETNRNSINEIISERALREIYLRGFEIAVKKSRPWTVMTSYNKVNDTYTSERRDLVTDILKKEWGFKGFVMTDWFGGHDPVAQMNAGNDLLMPGSPMQSSKIMDGVKAGKITMKQLNQNVEDILRIILKSPQFKHYPFSSHPDLKADAAVSREGADAGMILLKNENHALPLTGIHTIAAFGNTSYDLIANGTGSGNVNKPFVTSLLEGMKNAGYQAEDSLSSAYQHYIYISKGSAPRLTSFFMLPPPIPEMTISPELADYEANLADIAVITLGRNAGEGADRKLPHDYYLSSKEKDMINTVAKAFHAKGKKVVVVLNIGGVIDVSSWRDQVDAILLAWQPGEEAGNAIMDIMSGKVDPSGKLAVTFPMQYQDVPSAKNFPGTPAGHPTQVIYQEGIYVGYRYYTTFHVTPAYPFGYGLSYTDFRISGLHLSGPVFHNSLSASVTVTNTGKVAGKDVAELYLSAPSGGLDKPAEELKAFGKTRLLQPGQSQTFHFTLHPGDLASYNTASSSWVAAAGTYTIHIGASCDDIRQSAHFNLAKALVTEKDKQYLTPPMKIDEMKR